MVISGKAERVKILKSALSDARGEPGQVLDGQLTIACARGSVRLLGLQRAGGRAIEAGSLPARRSGRQGQLTVPRYRMTVEYDGTPYRGWQRQANGPSVQQAIEDAVRSFSGEEVRLQVAGRTDSGVHATGQVSHVDLEKQWMPTSCVRR